MARPKKDAAAVAKALPVGAAETKEFLTELLKDYPAVDVLKRRLTDPHDPGSLPILLKDEAQGCCMNSDHQRDLPMGATQCRGRDAETGKRCGKPARKWHIHTCNTAIEGRWAQMKSKGYIPVLVEELQDTEDVSDLVRQKEDNGTMYVRRGDRGKEITMKIPIHAYNYINKQKLDERIRRSKSKRAQREDLAESIHANAELGAERDQAAQMVHSGGISIETMKHERTTLGAEAGTD
jgi:hypothetical protein